MDLLTCLSYAVSLRLSGCVGAWDYIEENYSGDMHKLKFIWDYVWHKEPEKRKGKYRWAFVHQSELYRHPDNPWPNSITYVIDVPVKGVFCVYRVCDSIPLGWDLESYMPNNIYIPYKGWAVSSQSTIYSTRKNAFLYLIFNWYTNDTHDSYDAP